ncbi:hypothetical protein E1218_23460 [Kribbella turkmenica]|uniref:Uncharacterized protein n=2 Tax=Kribbella turkmenica TaxID=2530375 RepID=A0A4R4WL13_9ACTN|nr:hypothetical protein E1218_23460 [Kribbella turkmenica]
MTTIGLDKPSAVKDQAGTAMGPRLVLTSAVSREAAVINRLQDGMPRQSVRVVHHRCQCGVGVEDGHLMARAVAEGEVGRAAGSAVDAWGDGDVAG